MRWGFLSRFFFLFLVAAFLVGCITFHLPPPPGPPADYSFPVTGEVRETGNVASVIERRGPFSRARAAPRADILLTGVITQPPIIIETTLPRTVTLRYQQDDSSWLLPLTRRQYRWNGTINVAGNPADTMIEFYVHAGRDGSGKRFILTNAHLGQVRLEADDPVEVYYVDIRNFPFLVGYVHLQSNSYRVFAVLNNSPNRMLGNEIFFNPVQKFQFLNNQNNVVAELHIGRYTIYDTLPEAEIGEMKQAIALFTAYRHATTVLRSIADDWHPPFFHRFVYP
jgi:hypothetical protein